MKDVKFYQLEGKNVLALLSGSVEGAEPIAVGSVDAAKKNTIPVVNRVRRYTEVTVGVPSSTRCWKNTTSNGLPWQRMINWKSNSSNPVKNRKPYSQPSTPASYTNRAISTVFGKRNFKR